jgi:hypothetical protein
MNATILGHLVEEGQQPPVAERAGVTHELGPRGHLADSPANQCSNQRRDHGDASEGKRYHRDQEDSPAYAPGLRQPPPPPAACSRRVRASRGRRIRGTRSRGRRRRAGRRGGCGGPSRKRRRCPCRSGEAPRGGG